MFVDYSWNTQYISNFVTKNKYCRFPSYLCLGIGQVSSSRCGFMCQPPFFCSKENNFLLLFKMITTVVVLYVAKMNKMVQFPDLDRSIVIKVSGFICWFDSFHSWKHFLMAFVGQIFPLPLLYVGNHVTGLGSTKKLRLKCDLFKVNLHAQVEVSQGSPICLP